MKVLKNLEVFSVVLITILLICCAPQSVSTIVGCDYDEKKNETTYFILPFGIVTLPGKWEKSNYNSSSRQQFFTNIDSVTISIAFGLCDMFEFNANKSISGFEFIKTYYNWDSQYFKDNLNMNTDIVEMDSINNYIIWKISGIYDNANVTNYFLFGENNCNVSAFSILNTDKWTDDGKVNFLRSLYLREKRKTT